MAQNARESYQRNREARIAYSTEYGKKHPERRRRAVRNACYRRNYGITLADYERMLEAQGGVCATCGGLNENGREIAVDHCHTTGKVRGLLCTPCNQALGHAKDDPIRLRAMAAYLEAQ